MARARVDFGPDAALVRVLLAADAQASALSAQLVALRNTIAGALALAMPQDGATDPRDGRPETFDDAEQPPDPKPRPVARERR